MKSVFRGIGALTLFACAFALAACGGGGGGATGPSVPSATPTPAQLGTTCLAPGQSAARVTQSVSSADGYVRIPVRREGAAGYLPDQLAVQYRTSVLNSLGRTALSQLSGADIIKEFSYPQRDVTLRVFRVAPANVQSMQASLKAQPGVTSVDRVAYKYPMTAQPLITNDPYFAEPVPPSPPLGYVRPGPPYYESASVPGQWDMHAIGLENAYGYSQNTNSLNTAFPNAMGNAAVRIAVIDTGADVTHPDLVGGRIVRTECFITPASGPQTTSTNVSDFDGHGTNVAGIAGATVNNNYGFVGVGGNVSLMLYRIFPIAPPAGCPAETLNPQCGASSVDEATAINDAVANGAKVISLSLGSTSTDPTEQTAVLNAIANGVTVVAASGNGDKTGVGQPTLDFPAGYPGVIAVGASALDDTIPAAIVEKIASYSNYVAGSTTWGIVAPGGDPSGSSDADFLHWIEGIYSIRATPPCRAASGSTDFFGESGNCNVLIAGTSQATPHVSGAVALLLSVTPGLTPAQVSARLQASAHNIGDSRQGAGRLNVYRLLADALGDPSPPPK